MFAAQITVFVRPLFALVCSSRLYLFLSLFFIYFLGEKKAAAAVAAAAALMTTLASQQQNREEKETGSIKQEGRESFWEIFISLCMRCSLDKDKILSLKLSMMA